MAWNVKGNAKIKSIVHTKAKQDLALNIRSGKRKSQPLGRLIRVSELTLKRPTFNTKVGGS